MKTTKILKIALLFLAISNFSKVNAQTEIYDSNFNDKVGVKDDKLKVLLLYSKSAEYGLLESAVLYATATNLYKNWADFYYVNTDRNNIYESTGLTRHVKTKPVWIFWKNGNILHREIVSLSRAYLQSLIRDYK